MGNSFTNKIEYRTKDGIQISYLFWDLKGRNRFPQPPGDSQINFMLERCLDQIDASLEQIREIKQFNSKYKYRFVILHKRKVAEGKKQRQLQNLKRQTMEIRQSQNIKMKQQKSKANDLQELMKDVQLNETLIKVALMKIDKYIAQKYAHQQFISIKGLERLLQLLQKAIKINVSGTKTNFSNQIQLLKFFKFFSDRYPKEFYNYIPKVTNYSSIIIKTYHPVNTHITAYCLDLITDYLWRVEEGDHILKILQWYRLQENYESFLSPFTDTLNQTQSILMVYYNLKFINQLIASVIQEDKKQLLKQNLNYVKYGYVLDGIKAKLQQNYFCIQNTTFISMHQKIFRYATKDKTQKKTLQQNRITYRNTLNLTALHEQILLKFLQNNQNQDDENQENHQEILIAYLGQSDRKYFNKFIIDTLTELQKYNKLEFYLQNSGKNIQQEQTQQMVQSKINLQNLESYFGRIKQSCTKNNSNQVLNTCFKNLQYFQKIQWKHLERFILQQLGLQKKISEEVEQLKKQLDQKQIMIKRIIKQNIDLRNQISQIRNKDSFITERVVGKLSQNKQFLQQKTQKINRTLDQGNFSKKKQLPTLPKPPLIPGKSKKFELPQMPASLNKFLPKANQLPAPPNLIKKIQNQTNDQFSKQIVLQNGKKGKNQKPMRDRPKLQLLNQCIQIKIQAFLLQKKLQPKSINISTQLNNNILAPPPSLGSTNLLPPPPTLGVSNILPPPPSLGSTNILPPPPSLSGMNLLPPPPSLSSESLLPPPTLASTNILPPPPVLGSTNLLPPPPSLGSTNLLPPPPSLGASFLPPPPSLGTTNLLPPPPSLGLSNLLPPPPIIGTNILPPPLLGLPTQGGLPTASNLSLPGLGFQALQKVKEKRKPKVPLKACNYTTINYDKIVDTVFEAIDDTKLELNQDQLVQMFAKNITANNTKSKSEQEKTKNSTNSKITKQTVKLIGPDRWRNLQIILTKLKIPLGEIKKTLTECTGKYTSHSILQSISKILPTQQEQQMIKSFDGNQEDLGKPQRFLKQLIQVPQYASRVKAMIFSNIKQEIYYELSSNIQQLANGFSSLKQNKRFMHVLQVCLAIGNYLNGTTLKGGAWGFKIQTLERLEQIKSTDNKMNAAFYLIKEVWKQYPYPIFQKEEIEIYQYLSKMPISQVNQQLGELNLYFKSIQKAYKSNDSNNPNDNIGAYCQQNLMQLSVKLQQYKKSNQNLVQVYMQCAKFYCEDGKKIGSDQFGKKMFQCILFISNTQKMLKIIEDKRIKDQSRKAVKNEITYSEISNPQSNKKEEKKAQQKIPIEKIAIKMPDMSKLPPPPPKQINKQQKLKQIQKLQQQRQKKALEQVMMKRTSKLQAYRMSKMSQANSSKKGLDTIDFLKGI